MVLTLNNLQKVNMRLSKETKLNYWNALQNILWQECSGKSFTIIKGLFWAIVD